MRGCFKFDENPALLAHVLIFIANIYLMIWDAFAGKASHTLCYFNFLSGKFHVLLQESDTRKFYPRIVILVRRQIKFLC